MPGWEDVLTVSQGMAEWTSPLRGSIRGGEVRQGWDWGGPHSCFSFSPLEAMGIKTALPTAELGLYSLVLSGALAYAGQGLLEASQGNGGARGRPGTGAWKASEF